MSHMKHNRLFSNSQHGFRSGRSTVTQLLESLESWTKMLDEVDTKSIDIVYCDFQKAFDSVPHRRLLDKVKIFGITSNIHKWIETFLTGRRQKVRADEALSRWCGVTSGIPQGSVLGPILFVLFINDLPDVVNCGVEIYADDTKIFAKATNKSEHDSLQENIDKMYRWSEIWQLTFHPEKCHVMHIGPKYENEEPYYMGKVGSKTQLLETEKDLGVYIDKNLLFNVHCQRIANAANRLVGLTRRLFDYLDATTFQLIYKALIRPRIEYASSVWSPVRKPGVEIIERVQRRATKMLPGMADLYEERLKKLDLPTLVFRRMRGDIIQVYKYFHELYDVEHEDILPRSENINTRGHHLKLKKNHGKNRTRRHFFSQRIVNSWNGLPEEVVSTKHLNAFKSAIDKHWKRHPLKFD